MIYNQKFLVVEELNAATEILIPCTESIVLGKTPVEGAGETIDGGLVRIKTIELARRGQLKSFKTVQSLMDDLNNEDD